MPTYNLYNWQLLDPNTVTSLYLYGTFTPPVRYDARIRANTDDPVNIELDMATTVANGPSRACSGHLYA
jgi:hypothetical protein